MADGFAVRPELLAAPAAAFDDASRLLRSAVAQARADLAALGDASGDDEQGRAFKSRYDPVVAEGLAAIGRSADVVSSFGGGLRAAADQYAVDDDDAARGMDPTERP